MIHQPVIHLLSGGLDSTMLLYELHRKEIPVHCLLFNYNQRHLNELSLAKEHCQELVVPFTVIELFRIQGLFARSALTDGEGTKVVPNRNAVFLNIAAGIAASQGVQMVTIGVNKDDANDFPDCRREFIESMNATLKLSGVDVEICAPWIGMTKWQIVQFAKERGWPYKRTVSCYTGNNCGTCDACKQRAEALK